MPLENLRSLLEATLSNAPLVRKLWTIYKDSSTDTPLSGVAAKLKKQLERASKIPVLQKKLATLSVSDQIKYLHEAVPFFLFICFIPETEKKDFLPEIRKLLLDCVLSHITSIVKKESLFLALTADEIKRLKKPEINLILNNNESYINYTNSLLQEVLTNILPLTKKAVVSNIESFFLLFGIKILLLLQYIELQKKTESQQALEVIDQLFFAPLLLSHKREGYIYNKPFQFYNTITQQLYQIKDTVPYSFTLLNVFAFFYQAFPLINTNWLVSNIKLDYTLTHQVNDLFSQSALKQIYFLSTVYLVFGKEHFHSILTSIPKDKHPSLQALLAYTLKISQDLKNTLIGKRSLILLNELKSHSAIFMKPSQQSNSSRINIGQKTISRSPQKRVSMDQIEEFLELSLTSFFDRLKMEGRIKNGTLPIYLYDFAITSMPVLNTSYPSHNVIHNFFQSNLTWFKRLAAQAHLASNQSLPFFSVLDQNIEILKTTSNKASSLVSNIGKSLQDLALTVDLYALNSNKTMNKQDILLIQKNQILNTPLIPNVYEPDSMLITPVEFFKLPLASSQDPDLESWHHDHFLYLQLLTKQNLFSEDYLKILLYFKNHLLKIQYKKYFSLFRDRETLEIDELVLYMVFDLLYNNALYSIRTTTI